MKKIICIFDVFVLDKAYTLHTSIFQVFQKRFNGRLDFYQTFKEYEDGFGGLHAEFWMGNTCFITSQKKYEDR